MAHRGKTIAVLMGASEFPNYPSLEPEQAAAKQSLRDAFRNSHADIFKYLTGNSGLKLAKDLDLLDLFDSDLQPGELIGAINRFLEQQCADSNPPTDIIFYYCGHGAYLKDREYFLALRCTDRQSKEATVFKMGYLVDIIRTKTKDRRNLIILDACYSGGALIEFANLADDDGDAAQLLNSELEVVNQSENASDSEPTGAILFCAAGPKRWAMTPLEAKHTMFTGALVQTLSKGDDRSGPNISLKRLSELVRLEIQAAFGRQGVPPQIHVPTQENPDLLEIPYFPNPKFDPTAFGTRLSQLEGMVREMRETVNKAVSALKELPERPAATKEIVDRIPYVSDGILSVPPIQKVSRVAATFLFVAVVDILTYVLLRGAIKAGIEGPPSNVAGNTLIFLASLHFMILAISIFVILARRRALYMPVPSVSPMTLDEPFLLYLVPKQVSYLMVMWNSLLVLLVFGYITLTPDEATVLLFGISHVAKP